METVRSLLSRVLPRSWWCWEAKDEEETERIVRANNETENSQYHYANNYIKTSKYNALTFLPLNLFEQFQRLANAYFLFLLILQVIPQISSLSYVTTVVPLVGVLALTAIKDLIDDIRRHRSDSQVNNRVADVLRDGVRTRAPWHQVVVGDIIKMENNQFVAADLLLLATSEPNSLCYIETAELDGETNLKVKQALVETAAVGDDLAKWSQFDGQIVCEPPNNVLSKFEGKLQWNNHSYSLNNDHMLLRGCVLRNTAWCYGLVIFAGQDTKLMMNSGKTKFKRTHTDRLMNVLIAGIVLFLASICLLCVICAGVWETMTGYSFQVFLPWEIYVPGTTIPGGVEGTREAGATVIAILVFFSYIIVLNTVVPISLYVSVEILRMGHSWWIDWDVKMYCEEKKTPAKARTTTLNEELGQIEYIFSDKTGTLTQNVMTFNKCSIAGVKYGDPEETAESAMPEGLDDPPRVDLSCFPHSESTFEWYDPKMVTLVQEGHQETKEFFTLLALCHTVMPEMVDGQLIYQAQSPDEEALVGAARNFGFVFKSRSPSTISIEVAGKEELYELLCILDFNNVRKRMSVIVKKDDKIQLLCKGADTTIYERLGPESEALSKITTDHLNDFANVGLRTLCLAYKDLTTSEYEAWKKEHYEASIATSNRDDELHNVYEKIETNMTLMGATAIEDKLQDGVPDTIANLATAGIKIWVLTGDKQETAINIGYSCKLLTQEMADLYTVDGTDAVTVRKQLTTAKQAMLDILKKGYNISSTDVNGGFELVSYANLRESDDKVESEETFGGFGIVINGHSLVYALSDDMQMLLLETACLCKAVICCRVTPLQKALVVDLVKKHKKTITLAIGDGANDVSMIKTAHIGVGISGQEGLQAVLASDFSFAQFRFLQRLLLVHGRWSYLRMSKFLQYFFYKNFAFTLAHLWYSFFVGFSAATAYDAAFIGMYNVIFTSLPVLALGIFDKDLSDVVSQNYPKLYTPGHKDLLFNKKVFAFSVLEGLLTSFVMFMSAHLALNNGTNYWGQSIGDSHAVAVTVAGTLIMTVTLRCAIEMWYWTWLNHLFVWFSIVVYYIFCFIIYSNLFSSLASFTGAARMTMSTGNYWFTVALGTVVCLVPIVAIKVYNSIMHPTLCDKLRRKIQMKRSESRTQHPPTRSRTSVRREMRSGSFKSGYAFAHEPGFGQLIMSGKNQRTSGAATSTATSTAASAAIATVAAVAVPPARNSINQPI